jgi:predicted alpha-1,2-mannosidase
MTKNLIHILVCIILISDPLLAQSNLKYINPFIGTDGYGHTFPGATTPFGMEQLSPDTDYDGWHRVAGYHYSDSTIRGVSHTHLSGTGVIDLCDLVVMPTVGDIQWFAGKRENPNEGYRSRFSHKNEQASAGYYSVILDDYKIKAELTASNKVGMHRYTFPNSTDKANIIIDPNQIIARDNIWIPTDVTDCELNVLNDSTIEGYRYSYAWSRDQKMYFVIQFSKPFYQYGFMTWDTTVVQHHSFKNDVFTKGYFRINVKANESIIVKVGISSVSKEGAHKNMLEEVPSFDFDQVKKNAEQKWAAQIDKIKIEATEEQKEIFYTAMYHAAIAPNVISDVDGKYYGIYQRKINQFADKNYYSTFSLCDTYRATHPLYTIINTDLVSGMINSLLAFNDDKGHLPIWPLWGYETYCMIGNHSIPVIADAINKDIKGIDIQKAYQAVYQSSIKPRFRSEHDLYEKYGFMPSDLVHDDAVSKTLELGYNDWCVAQMALKLGLNSDYKMFSKRSMAYKNVYDSKLGFMRGKSSDGKWYEEFKFNPNKFEPRYYTEATAWQYLWYVPHDVKGLIELMGGKDKFSQKLDTIFKLPSSFEGERSDITGLIGQYAHGNEPSHHLAYLFNYSQKPWLTQLYLRKILSTLYNTQADGLCGNEDCGQMSAWYIFSAMGLYPVNPASGRYDIGSPILKKSSIDVGAGKYFHVIAANASDSNKYIKSIKLNGKPYRKLYIQHADIMNGGTLEFEMSNRANKQLSTYEVNY